MEDSLWLYFNLFSCRSRLTYYSISMGKEVINYTNDLMGPVLLMTDIDEPVDRSIGRIEKRNPVFIKWEQSNRIRNPYCISPCLSQDFLWSDRFSFRFYDSDNFPVENEGIICQTVVSWIFFKGNGMIRGKGSFVCIGLNVPSGFAKEWIDLLSW